MLACTHNISLWGVLVGLVISCLVGFAVYCAAQMVCGVQWTSTLVGGACALTVQVGESNCVTYPFFIRGKNPLDATAEAYVSANVDEEFRPYAWMIARHESKNQTSMVDYDIVQWGGWHTRVPFSNKGKYANSFQ